MMCVTSAHEGNVLAKDSHLRPGAMRERMAAAAWAALAKQA
jgi:hypothetical protein